LAAFAALAAVCLPVPPSAAQDCPSAQTSAHGTSAHGFVVERNESQTTEVYDAGQGLVHVVTRYNGQTLLETTQYAGLFFIERLDRGRRTTYQPKTDLKALFPLKSGAQLHAKFITERDGSFGRLYVELDVGKSEDLFIGACKYAVLRIERRESSNAVPPQFVYTDLYSPDLKFVLGREYRHQGGQTQLIKYDRIHPLKN
jgi:hypothetical protein